MTMDWFKRHVAGFPMELTIEGFPTDFPLKSWDLIFFVFWENMEKPNFWTKPFPCRNIFMEQIGWVLKICPFVFVDWT